MDRRAVAQSLSAAVALPLALHAEAEAELASAREEVAQLRAALAQEKAARARDAEVAAGEMRNRLAANKAEFDSHEREVTDYERTVAGLREKLREEETRRASYQAGDALARRLHAESRLAVGEPGSARVDIDVPRALWNALVGLCERA